MTRTVGDSRDTQRLYPLSPVGTLIDKEFTRLGTWDSKFRRRLAKTENCPRCPECPSRLRRLFPSQSLMCLEVTHNISSNAGHAGTASTKVSPSCPQIRPEVCPIRRRCGRNIPSQAKCSYPSSPSRELSSTFL